MRPSAPCTLPVPVRLSAESVAEQAAAVGERSDLLAVLEAFPGPAALLNDHRQVLVANSAFRGIAHAIRLGDRPGDALGCVAAAQGPNGCGSTVACRMCGMANGLGRLEAGAAGPQRQECLLTREADGGPESLEFEAGLSRLAGGLVMLAMRDIGGEKRRRVLERCFLHDALNAAGGVQGMAELAATGDRSLDGMLPAAAAAVVDELRYHQALLAAESGEPAPQLRPLTLTALFDEVVAQYAGHRLGHGRRVTLAARGLSVRSDRVLLRRVLGNLLKNALEACGPGSAVDMEALRNADRIAITVRNPGEMSPEIQTQVFRRFFSTKSANGRGIGTWSVKLLVERYLGGSVSFACAGGQTAFRVELPVA